MHLRLQLPDQDGLCTATSQLAICGVHAHIKCPLPRITSPDQGGNYSDLNLMAAFIQAGGEHL